jgi:molecular chaperone DnaK
MGKITHGIDLGTTNSALCKVTRGEVKIIKNSQQKDTTVSCIAISKRQTMLAGDKAFNLLKQDRNLALMRKSEGESNVYIEFKRTMGTDKKYNSSHMNKEYSSEDLSAEVLKILKSYDKDEEFQSVVITVPAMFNDNQNAATSRAAKLAGFKQVELLQEPIAAAMQYGLDSSVKDAKILVFDFGGGTFDAALIDAKEGVFQVKDTEGDNKLGGKNLDMAIVNEILIPKLRSTFKIDSYLENDEIKSLLVNALKKYADEAKIALSFEESHKVESEFGEFPEDDNGEEIDLDFTISSNDLEPVLGPIFQQAIDLTKKLIERNNIDKSKITLLLVGGPTFSPILRKMLTEQICTPDTSVDPMTVVAKGAALYATTFDVAEEIVDEQRDETKLQLEFPSLKSHTVEDKFDLVVKVNKAKTQGTIADKLFCEVTNDYGSYNSGKIALTSDFGDIIEDVLLESNKPNNFTVTITDEAGSKVDCEPNEFTVFQGLEPGSATLPYHYGIEIFDSKKGKLVLSPIPGLEKNNTFPALGEKSGLRTTSDIKPGSNNSIKIPIYQGHAEAMDTRAINSGFVHMIEIQAEKFPRFCPEGTEVNIQMTVNSGSDISLTFEIPSFDIDLDFKFGERKAKGVSSEEIDEHLENILSEIKEFEDSDKECDAAELDKIKQDIERIKSNFEANKIDYDNLIQTKDNLKSATTKFDNLDNASTWPSIEKELKEEFYKLQEEAEKSDDSDIKSTVTTIESQLKSVIERKDVKAASELKDRIGALNYKLLSDKSTVSDWIGIIYDYDKSFDSHPWKDRAQARMLINQGKSEATGNPTKDRIQQIVYSLWNLLPRDQPRSPSGGQLGS